MPGLEALQGLDAMAIWDKVKDLLLFDKVVARLTQYWDMIPDVVFDTYYKHRESWLILAVCLLVLIAFEGYKFFKMALYVGGAAGLGIVGYYTVGPIVAKYAGGFIPEFVKTEAIVAILFALLAIFIVRCAYNFAVMLLGTAFGFLVGYVYVWRVIRDFFSTLAFLKNDIARYIIAGVMAAVFTLLFILLFKHVFIVCSSFGALGFAGLLVQKLVVPGADDMMKGCFILVGLAVAVFAVVHQYKEEEKAMEIVF